MFFVAIYIKRKQIRMKRKPTFKQYKKKKKEEDLIYKNKSYYIYI